MSLLLIDGFNLAYRCFFATPPLNRSDGFPTNALHGWVKSLWRLIDEHHPERTAVFFDLGGSQARLALHPSYKAQRAEMPAPLAQQLEALKELTHLLGFALIEQDGIESDDLLAACACQAAAEGQTVLIVSSDKDFAQIVSDRISLLLPPPSAQPRLGWRLLNPAGVVEKFGVPPAQIPDYLALIGDTSDNIPGLTGVGPKTASTWLTRYGSLEKILAAADHLDPLRFRAPLLAAADRLRLNLRLVTLDLTLPAKLPTPPQQPQVTPLLAFLNRMEMRQTLGEAEKRYREPELF